MTDVADLAGSSDAAVEAFSRWHDTGAPPPAGARYVRELPATAPGPGQQYRFEVDLDRCTGCKACVSACHTRNGLDAAETWRSVGLLVGGGGSEPVWTQHVTTACHHCVEPACMAGCPVDAYEKDPVTGIVAHLDDQCIGCRYCMLTCPYEVPTFNERLGVVRKCDMCAERLGDGAAPACVQGCPTEAISIGVVDVAEVQAEALADPDLRLVPGAPCSSLTTPTTVYLSSRGRPDAAVGADEHHLEPAHGHPPLVAMLVLTQASVGAYLATAGGSSRGAALVSWIVALVAVAASVLHLGRPAVAWRAVIGLGHSWLSREIVAFGAYAALGGAVAASALGLLPLRWEPALVVLTALAGLVGIWCSAVLYAVTGRRWWRLDRTLVRFGATTALAACATSGLAASVAGGSARGPAIALSVVVVAIAVVTMRFETRHRHDPGELGRTVRLLDGRLSGTRRLARVAVAVAVVLAWAATLMAALVGNGAVVSVLCWVGALLAVVASAWAERTVFFTAASPDRMPGGLR